ncbi:MAG: hypothetical protein IKG22_13060, partial [Atopobiaceae bacterium]|nr:hypothetical protein [Atopobiaceae bacterium]
ARGILADILASDGAGGPMPPSQKTVSAYVQDSTMTRGSQMRAYEAVGILTAYLPLCSVNVHSPTEVVPERFAFVVFDEGHCVSGTYFNQLLERVRARVPQHAGAMDEHSIGYVARQLREPFARVRDRYVAQVNGIGVDFTDEVRAIPGAALVRHRGTDATRDVLDLGMATISIDRLALINGGMYLTQADSAVDWAQSMMRSSLEFACDRMAMANASALLRSPDAARLLVEAGVRIENPTTGERMSLDPSTGRVMCGFERVPAAAIPDGDDPALMEWYYLRVANDDGWRIAHDDALTLIRDREGPMAGLLQDSREAYLADSWLTAKDRIEAIPTRERAEELLRRRDVPNMPTRQYRLRDKCGTEGMHAIGEAPARVTATRVA